MLNEDLLQNCTLCPRLCRVDRRVKTGVCQGGMNVRVARAALHFWEEPCISGNSGSGTVFFSGCNLKCVFCQNHTVSHGNFGQELSVSELARVFSRLEDEGAENINLVNPTHYVPMILEALKLTKVGIPVVYNSSGYERVETLRLLEGVVDVYLPDVKYFSSELSTRYSGAKDYFPVAMDAVREMLRQTGEAQFDESGLMTRGTMVRHLILPSRTDDSIEVLSRLFAEFGDRIYISLMSQFTPMFRASEFPEISRKLTRREVKKVTDFLLSLPTENGFLQERSAASEDFVPAFSLEGLEFLAKEGESGLK